MTKPKRAPTKAQKERVFLAAIAFEEIVNELGFLRIIGTPQWTDFWAAIEAARAPASKRTKRRGR